MLSLNANEGKFVTFMFAVVFDVASFVSEVNWYCPDVSTFRLSCDTQYFLCFLCQEFVQPCGTSFYVGSRTVYLWPRTVHSLSVRLTVYLP